MREKSVIAVEGSNEAGGVVWWRLSSELYRSNLLNAWTQAGLEVDLLPEPASAEAALGRTVNTLRDTHTLIRRLPKRAGWAVVSEIEMTNGELDYNVRGTVWLAHDGTLNTDLPIDMTEQVEVEFKRQLGALQTTDISAWLVKLTQLVRAVPLRESGGIYFVPKEGMSEWREMAEVLEGCSQHAISVIPAMRTQEAVKAILRAVTAEAEARAIELETDLMNAALGKRAIETRIDRCTQARDMLSAYDELLGEQLVQVRERFDRIRANLAAASLRDEDPQQALSL